MSKQISLKRDSVTVKNLQRTGMKQEKKLQFKALWASVVVSFGWTQDAGSWEQGQAITLALTSYPCPACYGFLCPVESSIYEILVSASQGDMGVGWGSRGQG